MRKKVKDRLVGIMALVITTSFIFRLLSGSLVYPFPEGSLSRMHVTHTFKTPLTAYRLDMKEYPTTEEGLNALIQAPEEKEGKWKGPYIEELPLDEWNMPYQYRYPGIKNVNGSRSYDLWSVGPDGYPSEDDITNWQEPKS